MCMQMLKRLVPPLTVGECAGGHRAENRRKSRDIMIQPRESVSVFRLLPISRHVRNGLPNCTVLGFVVVWQVPDRRFVPRPRSTQPSVPPGLDVACGNEFTEATMRCARGVDHRPQHLPAQDLRNASLTRQR